MGAAGVRNDVNFACRIGRAVVQRWREPLVAQRERADGGVSIAAVAPSGCAVKGFVPLTGGGVPPNMRRMHITSFASLSCVLLACGLI